ncbi:MAG: 2-amino-4-hydroxy-6-hydroxymethyldihydropteridine diphosphokinase [Candidatus Omnitrophota bacterium]
MVYYLGVGTNLGDRCLHIKKALEALIAIEGLLIRNCSPLYETQAQGGPQGQEDYYNLVLEIECGLTAQDLLENLKTIERKLGRDFSAVRWSARPIDLDILLCDDVIVNEDSLMVPHPLMHERFFVLKPLSDLRPDLLHPLSGLSISSLLGNLKDVGRWKKVDKSVCDLGEKFFIV